MPDSHPETESENRGFRWGRAAWLWGPPVLYTGLIFLVSSIPWGKPPLVWTYQDKIVHFVEYGILSALLFRALGAGIGVWGAAGLAFLASAALGGLDELYQSTVPKRAPDILDACADAVGALVGALSAVGLSAFLRRSEGAVTPGSPGIGDGESGMGSP
ncbi:MAG: VanZ family protein [Planctomycetota bacterium]|jgi:VanZ family protein